eukprot:2155166-Amphidinium_carterae.1
MGIDSRDGLYVRESKNAYQYGSGHNKSFRTTKRQKPLVDSILLSLSLLNSDVGSLYPLSESSKAVKLNGLISWGGAGRLLECERGQIATDTWNEIELRS